MIRMYYTWYTDTILLNVLPLRTESLSKKYKRNVELPVSHGDQENPLAINSGSIGKRDGK